MQEIAKKPLFPLGQIVATPGALAALEKAGQRVEEFLALHATGEWGDLCAQDRVENQLGPERGFRLMSSYTTNAGDKIWMVTEADRSATTILLSEEY